MDQVKNNAALGMLQTIAAQNQGIKMGKGDTDSDFQKLMDKAASGQPDSSVEDRPRAERPTEAKKPVKTASQKEVQDPVEQSEEAAEQGLVVVGTVPAAMLDTAIIKADLVEEGVGIPLGDGYAVVYDNQQLLSAFANAQTQPQQQEGPQVIDVSDPKADAMLEATAPGADNSPAAMLEKVVAEQTGREIQPDAGKAQPQRQEDDTEFELIDVEQGPQQIFHDVKAAPVKVGEVERPQQTEEPDVVQQLDGQIGLAIERGDSSVTVRLNPENLGEVTIQISMKDNGVLSVALNAKNDATRALLDRHSDNLQQLLSSRVRETVEVDVQRGQESQQDQNQQHQGYDGHNGHAQDGQERRRRQQEPASSQDFMQQLRLGLIPTDGEL